MHAFMLLIYKKVLMKKKFCKNKHSFCKYKYSSFLKDLKNEIHFSQAEVHYFFSILSLILLLSIYSPLSLSSSLSLSLCLSLCVSVSLFPSLPLALSIRMSTICLFLVDNLSSSCFQFCPARPRS